MSTSTKNFYVTRQYGGLENTTQYYSFKTIAVVNMCDNICIKFEHPFGRNSL